MAHDQYEKQNVDSVFTGPYVDIQDAFHFLIVIAIHICIKLFWKTVITSWPHDHSDEFCSFMAVLLACADGLVQLYVGLILDFELAHMRCGYIFMLIYTYWYLPTTATSMEILTAAHMLSSAFNAGCALEVGLGLYLNYISRNPVAYRR